VSRCKEARPDLFKSSALEGGDITILPISLFIYNIMLEIDNQTASQSPFQSSLPPAVATTSKNTEKGVSIVCFLKATFHTVPLDEKSDWRTTAQYECLCDGRANVVHMRRREEVLDMPRWGKCTKLRI
jgi:hypothetical protein